MPRRSEIHGAPPDPAARGPRGPWDRRRTAGLAAAIALLVAGCASGPEKGDVEKAARSATRPEVTSDGLHLVRATPRSKLWVRPDHHLGRYDDVLVAGIAFAYARGQDRLDPDQEKKVGEMLVEAVNGFTEGTPVGRADAPGECVVALELALKDLRLHINQAHGSAVSFVSSFGDVTMIVEFRDSTSRTPLLRYAAHRGLGSGPATGRLGADLNRLGRALGEMVTDMVTELQTAVPDTTERPETVCNEGIYKLTGRG